MLMQKGIFQCIHPYDWFAAIDLKDTYFFVSSLPQHMPFLRSFYNLHVEPVSSHVLASDGQ